MTDTVGLCIEALCIPATRKSRRYHQDIESLSFDRHASIRFRIGTDPGAGLPITGSQWTGRLPSRRHIRQKRFAAIEGSGKIQLITSVLVSTTVIPCNPDDAAVVDGNRRIRVVDRPVIIRNRNRFRPGPAVVGRVDYPNVVTIPGSLYPHHVHAPAKRSL